MRVLIVTEHFWPETFRVTDLAVALTTRGHDVEVITAMPNYPAGRYFDGYTLRGPYREDVQGVTVRRVPVVPRGSGRAWRLALNYASYAVMATSALAIRRARWDVVFVFQPTPVSTIAPALTVRRRSVPVVTWIQDLWPHTLRSSGVVGSPALLRWAERLSGALYRSAICCSRRVRRTFRCCRRWGSPARGLDSFRTGRRPSMRLRCLERRPCRRVRRSPSSSQAISGACRRSRPW